MEVLRSQLFAQISRAERVYTEEIVFGRLLLAQVTGRHILHKNGRKPCDTSLVLCLSIYRRHCRTIVNLQGFKAKGFGYSSRFATSFATSSCNHDK